jgi:hypothetical protein
MKTLAEIVAVGLGVVLFWKMLGLSLWFLFGFLLVVGLWEYSQRDG